MSIFPLVDVLGNVTLNPLRHIEHLRANGTRLRFETLCDGKEIPHPESLWRSWKVEFSLLVQVCCLKI